MSWEARLRSFADIEAEAARNTLTVEKLLSVPRCALAVWQSHERTRPFVKHHLLEFIGIAIGAKTDGPDAAAQLALKILKGVLTRSWLYLERIKVSPILNGLIAHYLSGDPAVIIPNLLQIFGLAFEGLQPAEIGRLEQFDAFFIDLFTSEKSGADEFLNDFPSEFSQSFLTFLGRIEFDDFTTAVLTGAATSVECERILSFLSRLLRVVEPATKNLRKLFSGDFAGLLLGIGLTGDDRKLRARALEVIVRLIKSDSNASSPGFNAILRLLDDGTKSLCELIVQEESFEGDARLCCRLLESLLHAGCPVSPCVRDLLLELANRFFAFSGDLRLSRAFAGLMASLDGHRDMFLDVVRSADMTDRIAETYVRRDELDSAVFWNEVFEIGWLINEALEAEKVPGGELWDDCVLNFLVPERNERAKRGRAARTESSESSSSSENESNEEEESEAAMERDRL
jgi:hypothetical protein